MKVFANAKKALGLFALSCAVLVSGSSRLEAAVIVTIGDTGTPLSSLGGFNMTPLAQGGARFAQVTSTAGSPSVTFSQSVFETMADGALPPPYFGTWSHGYTGNVWHTSDSGNARSLTLLFPALTKAFYFYLQPVDNSTVSFELAVPGLPPLPPLSISGTAGATFIGLHTDAGEDLVSIKVTSENTTAGAFGFAVGEFGIFNSGGGGGGVVPEPTSMAIFGLSGLAFLAKRATSKRRSEAC
jgi:hypothetical protein